MRSNNSLLDGLSKSGFTGNFIKLNNTDRGGFKEWLICNGMLFNSGNSWWGAGAKRKKPHEGLDLCFYRDSENRVRRLNEAAKIPVMYDGTVIGIFDDFLGKSLFLQHDITDSAGSRLCTVFGHIIPDSGIYPGKIVKQGEIAARTACPEKSAAGPHLHITAGRPRKEISEELLNWKTIGDPDAMTLIDPLALIDGYKIVPASEIFSNK